MAAQAFRKKLEKHESGVIVCEPASVVDLLCAMRINVSEGVGILKIIERYELAQTLLAKLYGSISIYPDDTDGVPGSSLMWLDGRDASKLWREGTTTVYSGPLVDAFKSHTRKVHMKKGDRYYRGILKPGQKLSELIHAD